MTSPSRLDGKPQYAQARKARFSRIVSASDAMMLIRQPPVGF
jgi:hypothetical protein